MDIIFQKPKPGDIGWLISVHGKSYAKQFNFDAEFEIDIARKVIAFLEAKNDFNLLLIANADHCRAGSIAVSEKAGDTAFINFVLVLEEFRQFGIATGLLKTVIDHCRSANFRKIYLETYSCLSDARRLYKKFGFTPYKTKKGVAKYGQFFDQEFWEMRIDDD
ncbi:GNAT family N-acetyltransferase [Desulforhopalus singaporensis]|uniref:Acetyltransferase (GNAT) family protein n=1 Tax=Desulforhopalus singaporensis TaxID=91360 RepID=A0A1H0SM96_9BACT|nr:GNAT family N-acetyltransferase [Desulforhopalus singaporensis]SDP42276.1 Acetyltransferase (GNAT) family protein [Desulforhopalus singaporensis]